MNDRDFMRFVWKCGFVALALQTVNLLMAIGETVNDDETPTHPGIIAAIVAAFIVGYVLIWILKP